MDKIKQSSNAGKLEEKSLYLGFTIASRSGELRSGFVLFLARFINTEVFGIKNILPS